MKQLVPLVAEEENLSATRVPVEAGDENTQLSQPGTIDETSSSVDKCVLPSTNNQSENSADSHPVPTTKKHRRGSKTTKQPSSNVCPYSLRNQNRQFKVNQDARDELI